MNILLIVLVVIVALVALIFLIALFVKKEYMIEREIVIDKPKHEVFDYISKVKNQNHFSKWWMMDPDAKKEYTGTDGAPGFVAAWESSNKKVGKGEQEIKSITNGEKIDFEIRFVKPFEGKADSFMATTAVSETQARLKWGFSSTMKYPMNVMLLFIDIPKILGRDLEFSLSTLKNRLEN